MTINGATIVFKCGHKITLDLQDEKYLSLQLSVGVRISPVVCWLCWIEDRSGNDERIENATH